MVWYVIDFVALPPLFGDTWSGGKDEPGKYHTTKLGFINGIDQFDPLEFGISAKEAANFDPAIRLTLEAAQAVRPLFLFFPSQLPIRSSRRCKIQELTTGVPIRAFSSVTC